jgi:hypothetical protein
LPVLMDRKQGRVIKRPSVEARGQEEGEENVARNL